MLFFSILLLYLATLDTGLQPEELRGGDLITHQYAQVDARPSNAPGYPLYTIGGWLWFHTLRWLLHTIGILLPNPVPLLSSYSTLWALIALWLLYLLLCKVTCSERYPQGDFIIAALLTLFYAFTYFFWYYATTTEQYTSAIAQTLAIVYVYLRWREALKLGYTTSADRRLVGLALLCGLSLAHMLTVAFIVPPLVAAILWEVPQLLRRVKIIVACVIAAFLPLVSYLYVYIRGAAHPEWWGNGHWQNADQWFWAFVSTAQGREELSWGLEPGRAFFGGHFPALMWQELSLPMLVFGIIGITLLGRYLATTLYGTLAIYLLFCWMYRFGNWYQVILPIYPLLLIGLAAPLSMLERHIDVSKVVRQRRLVLILLLLAILWRFNLSFAPADSRHRPGDTALNQAALLLDQSLPEHASLFAAVDDTLAMQYLIDIWQIRPDLQTVSSAQAAAVIQQGNPLFATWESLATLRSELPAQSYQFQAQSPDWVEVRLYPTSLPPIENPDSRPIEEGVWFAGYRVQPSPTGAPVTNHGPAMDVTLFWRLEKGRWPAGLSLSVRPLAQGRYLQVGEGGTQIVQQDAAAPMVGLLANETVAPNTTIADPYRLPLPGEKKVDRIQVILYRNQATGFAQVAELNLLVQSSSTK
ncbi:MAG: DUF2723 domain-containing protein [Caldilineaceae bacterium]